MFKAALPAKVRDVMFASNTVPLAVVKKQTEGKTVPAAQQIKVGGAPLTHDVMKKKIFTAACKTYTEIRDDMLERLETGLDDKEVAYYTDLGTRSTKSGVKSGGKITKAYSLKKGSFKKVLTAARTHNASIMEDAAKVKAKGNKKVKGVDLDDPRSAQSGLEHLAQDRQRLVDRRGVELSKTADQAFPIDGPDLVEDDMPRLALEPTGGPEGIVMLSGGHGCHDEGADVSVELVRR